VLKEFPPPYTKDSVVQATRALGFKIREMACDVPMLVKLKFPCLALLREAPASTESSIAASEQAAAEAAGEAPECRLAIVFEANPGSAIGVVANRLPSFSYRNYTGFTLNDTDPLTGVQENVGVRYDLTGHPFNAPAGSAVGAQSFAERFIRIALERGAIAPLWEARTAAIQTQYGDPQAGLTEEERAGRNGLLAAQVTGDSQLWRPVALDLNGNGIQTTGALRSVVFDVDDSGYLKNTAWLAGGDGFLLLDRNLNGGLDSARELFSNGMLDISARGLAGLRWVDSGIWDAAAYVMQAANQDSWRKFA
jgi:hypothetical protein